MYIYYDIRRTEKADRFPQEIGPDWSGSVIITYTILFFSNNNNKLFFVLFFLTRYVIAWTISCKHIVSVCVCTVHTYIEEEELLILIIISGFGMRYSRS